ncbi:MAG TPA: flagellar basal body rod protein FlgC [Firmicutes bacterium]|nr:flagellar basal body rod protein FlgC [Bacillota bacterium]
MEIFRSFQISGSALTAEKLRVDVVAGNLANMQTTRTQEGGPYRRRTVVFAERLVQIANSPSFREGRGVKVAAIVEDPNPPRQAYDPAHPDANEQGFVAFPNIDLAKEMTDLITSSRSYEANATAINSAKAIYLKALEIGRG